MSELKPCPFCGRAMGVGDFSTSELGASIACASCGASCDWCDTRSDAATAWNRRTPQPVTPAGGEVDVLSLDYREGFKSGWYSYIAIHGEHPPVADAALVRDANRYRWLRSTGDWRKFDALPEAFDEGVDSGMRATGDAALNQRGGG